jgi:hypothetical protein
MPAYRPLGQSVAELFVAVAVAVNAHVNDNAHVDAKVGERP